MYYIYGAFGSSLFIVYQLYDIVFDLAKQQLIVHAHMPPTIQHTIINSEVIILLHKVKLMGKADKPVLTSMSTLGYDLVQLRLLSEVK